MKRIIDHVILITYCFFSVLFIPVNTAFVISFLLTIIFTTSVYSIHKKEFSLAITVSYVILAVFFPALYIFMPVFLYHMLQHQLYIPGAFSMIGLCFHFYGRPKELWPLVIFGLFLAFILQRRTSEYQVLRDHYKQTRDDSTELNLLLNQKNKSLVEKQDYEIYAATLQERNRIAREIHDNVGHMLTRSILMLGALKTVNKQEELTPSLENLEQTLSTAMNSVRTSVHDLHDESINLKEVIESLVKDFTFAPTELDYDMGLNVPREVKYSFISIAKEALTNITRHSNATRVHIIMREHPALYQISIQDNGTGNKEVAASGIGLTNIKDRVSALRGHLQIINEHGFKLFITIPKPITNTGGKNT